VLANLYPIPKGNFIFKHRSEIDEGEVMSVTVNYPISGANPSSVGGFGTGVMYFPSAPVGFGSAWNTSAQGVAGLNPASNPQISGTPSGTSAYGQLSVPGRNILNGQAFQVTASGDILFGPTEPSTTCAIKVYANTGTLTNPTYHDLLGSNVEFSNVPVDNVYLPWNVQLNFEGSNASGLLQGTYGALLNGVVVATAALTTIIGINFNSEPAFGLVIGVQFGASYAGNAANLYQFQLFAQ
jgi:hypothetical protein